MNNTLKGAGIVVAVVIAAIVAAEVVRPQSDTPATDSAHSIQAQLGAPSALATVLNRSCGDCHSNTMESRWYTRIPPFSTLMARGAREGRKAIDFSEWATYSLEQRRALLRASCTDATLGKMPMEAYLRFRSDARLSPQDIETICSAARQVDETSPTSATPQPERTR